MKKIKSKAKREQHRISGAVFFVRFLMREKFGHIHVSNMKTRS